MPKFFGVTIVTIGQSNFARLHTRAAHECDNCDNWTVDFCTPPESEEAKKNSKQININI
jgi:hypothetical protein